jgi:dTMP kinase
MSWYITAKKSKDTDVIVSVALFRKIGNDRYVLLSLRENNPAKGKWELPGGHVEDKEGKKEACIRELEEETGIKLSKGDLSFVKEKSTKHSDNDNLYTCMVGPVEMKAGSDAISVKWVKVDELDDMPFWNKEDILEAFSSANKEHREEEQNGLLIVIEGSDGAGKSTAADKVMDYLKKHDKKVLYSKWNSSDLLQGIIKSAKDRKILTPTLYSLLHASDMIYRYENEILPFLKDGGVVICDRYWYTSVVRDSIRGVDESTIKKIYKDLRDPDILFHFTLPPEIAMNRLKDDKGFSYYGAGKDLWLTDDEGEGVKLYFKLMDEKYREILPDCKNYCAINANRPKDKVFDDVKSKVKALIKAEDE